jgi:hypothetical protein
MESAELAADIVVQALARPAGPERERVLRHYPLALKARYGADYRLAGWFVKLINHPQIMRAAARHAMPRPRQDHASSSNEGKARS